MSWSTGAASERGESHDANEDAILVEWLSGEDESGGALLVAVADGMGGLERGQEASAAAIAALRKSLLSSEQAGTEALTSAFMTAHSEVRQLERKGRKPGRLGTTLVAAVLLRHQLMVANVGDSRAYRIGVNAVTAVTSDHSAAGEQLAKGLVSKDEAERSPYRHLLTRYLGARQGPPDIDLFECRPLRDGESLVLCSDGLYSVLDDGDIGLVVRSLEPSAAAMELIGKAQKRGASDDISAIVVKRERS